MRDSESGADAGGPAEWSIQQVAQLAGTTSRTLRHYHRIGLLRPARIGANGYRYYDRRALVELQRILMLRDLGLGLPAIAEVLARQADPVRALSSHLELLRQEQARLARQIASVEATIRSVEEGEEIMAEQMLDGFEHAQYRAEVEERWGAEAYARSDAWWRSKSEAERTRFRQQHERIARDYADARASGADPAGRRVQEIAARHFEWLCASAEATGAPVTAVRLRGYGDMYVADPRFAAAYGGADGAQYVRDALYAYAEQDL